MVSCRVVFGRGKQVVSGSEDKTVRVWTWRAARSAKFEGHTVMSGPCRQGQAGGEWSEDATGRVWDGRAARAKSSRGTLVVSGPCRFGRRQAGGEWVWGHDGEGVGRGERRGAESRGAHS